jgi:phenylacetic acid degradation operon negative regulatory protein
MAATRNTAERPTTPAARRPPLTARSVIASTLLGLDPPELRTAALVAGAELFGVRPGAARVALSRMVASGELAATPDGYRLAGALLARRARQDLSRRGAPNRWDGRWDVRIVPTGTRSAADRQELRAAMASLRFAPVRDGAWMRPANLPADVLPEAEATAATAIRTLGTVDDAEALASSLWDIGRWSTGAHDLLEEIAPLERALAAEQLDALAPSFVVAAAALRHLQADPLLPDELLPDGWPGAALRQEQAAFEASFRRLLRAWHLAR